MTIFPNIDPTVLAVTLLVVTGGMLLILLALGMSQPVLVRMGLRQLLRRPSQTLILLCGLVLSTVVMTASFGLWDSFAHSTLTYELAATGNVDESVTGAFPQVQVDSTLVSIRHNPNVQAATGIILHPASLTITSVRTGLTIENVDLYAVPPDFEQVYGPLTDARGQTVSVADLRPDEVLLSATLAQHFAVQPGEHVQMHIGAQTITSTVRALLSHDLAVISDHLATPTPAVVLPLARYQQIQAEVPNTLCIKNLGPGGMGDSGPNGSRSQAVVRFLQQLFHAPTFFQLPQSVTTFQSPVIEPIKPDTVDQVDLNKALLFSTAGQQFYWLLPLFTCLLVGAGMVLLALLLLLRAAERRAELGMSRALGFQRAHLVQLLLFEGAGSGLVAVVLGVPLGLVAIALELGLLGGLSQTPVFPTVDPNVVSTPVLLPLQVWLSWQSLVNISCLSLLTTFLADLLAARWISRMNIVTAIRDLNDPPTASIPMGLLLHHLWRPPVDAAKEPLPETRVGRRSRRMGAASRLLWEIWTRGPLCVLVGGVLLVLANAWGQPWLGQIALAVGLAGLSLLVRWGLSLLPPVAPAFARRVGFSCMGLAWLLLGFQSGGAFLALFQPVSGAALQAPSALEILLSMLLPVIGAVVLVLTNADLLVALWTFVFQRVRGLAPLSRLSLVYPVTFRVRTGVTVALLSLITFLVLLVVTINLGALQEAQAAASTGGFQVEADIISDNHPTLAPSPQMRAIQAHQALAQDFSAVGLLRLLYPSFGRLLNPYPIRLDLAGQPAYFTPYQTPLVADDGFLANTTLSLSARAEGYTSDRQVWDAVRSYPGDVVLRYQGHLGLPTSNGFVPFHAEVPDGSSPAAHYHQVRVIGIVASGTHWQALFLSQRTAALIVQPPYTEYNFYLFRLQPGVSTAQASRDLSRTLSADHPIIQALGEAGLLNDAAITQLLTLFLGSYLSLGLLFGVLSIGVIASRAVVERRQQIGMLRALGFSRTLVRRSFLIEASFVITVSLLVGASLAWWLAYQVARLVYTDDFPVPVLPVLMILLGSYVVAFVATLLPAHQAARLHPAEALRYE
ncbi:MAG TPA: FtsX-like permease family protein [Ktedonobacterales bacterium]|nr:FtsX-like permease family protein [Ktedonobacterales bacterium]